MGTYGTTIYGKTMGKYGNMMENTGKLWEIKETGAKW